MVLAFAGDSTITSEVEPGVTGPSSGAASATARGRALEVAFFLEAERRAVFLAAGRAAAPRPAMRLVDGSSGCSAAESFPRRLRASGVVFEAMRSVNGHVIGR